MLPRGKVVVPLAVLLVLGCGARTGVSLVPSGSDDGGDFNPVQPITCTDRGITYIYVISMENELYSYYPQTAEFTDIGPIDCPDLVGTPFSMAVDRQGVAYTVFSDGNLFKISTKTASCEGTPFAPGQLGFNTFGMGFVANEGNTGETLFIARDHLQPTDPPAALASIDLNTFTVTEIGLFPTELTGLELTGTGASKLYGFYTPMNGASSNIVRIDPNSAQILNTVTLGGDPVGDQWAFGFWGGDFYTFTAPVGSISTIVTQYQPSTGVLTQVATAPPGVFLVGAGVSTCAPQQ